MPAVILNKEDIVKGLAVEPSVNLTGTMGSLNGFLNTLDSLLKNPMVVGFVKRRFNFDLNSTAVQNSANPAPTANPAPVPVQNPPSYTAEMNYNDILSGVEALISGGFGQNNLVDVKTELINQKDKMISIIKQFKRLP